MRLLTPVLAAAQVEDRSAPAEDDLAADVAVLGIEALFDGAALERI